MVRSVEGGPKCAKTNAPKEPKQKDIGSLSPKPLMVQKIKLRHKDSLRSLRSNLTLKILTKK